MDLHSDQKPNGQKKTLLYYEWEPLEHRKIVKVLHVQTKNQKEFQGVINRFSKLERL